MLGRCAVVIVDWIVRLVKWWGWWEFKIKKKGKTTINKFNDTSNNILVCGTVPVIFQY